MVKLDYDRDYYADLELPATADVDEVKKQFRKLAFKWHPDRNPGKEELAKEKFVVIQSAHEILTDPVAKSKFDAHRQRTTRYPAASGIRGNPWQHTAQDVNQRFGAPPRRHGMPTRPPAQTAASTKAWDWAGRAKAKTEDARANMEAWDRARPQQRSAQPSAAAAGSGTRTAKSREQPPPPTPPRTAAQARRQEAAFGTRKTGYAPASPMGDEPPVKSQHYNTSANSTFGRTAASASKPRPTSAFVDPSSAEFSEPFPDNRQRTPYAANVGEKTNPFEPLSVNRAKSVRDGSTRFQDGSAEVPSSPPPRQRSASVGSDHIKRSTNEKPTFNQPTAKPTFPFQSRASARYSPRGPETNSAPPTATFSGPTSSSSSVNSSANGVNGDAAEHTKNGTKVFSVPVDDDPALSAQQARFMRNSADNINTRFVSEEKAEASFQFSAGSADDGFLRAKQRARGHQSPLRNEFTASSSQPFNGAGQPETGRRQGDFVPEKWKEAFGPHIFEPPQPARPSASPTRPIRPIKKPRPVRMTAGTAGMVDDDETSGEDKGKPSTATGGINGTKSPNAMDIDTPPPEPSAAQAAGPRNINVEPTKPEWRAGNVNGANNAEPKLGAGLRMPRLNPNAAGSEDNEEFMRPMLSELRNVEPLAQKPSGLGSFADLSSNLPFPSRASANIPLTHEKPKQLDIPIPSPPTAPRPPAALCVPGMLNLKAPSWMNYVREFEAYMAQWLEFNQKVTVHFAARQGVNKTNGLQWLNTQGDPGVHEYLRSLEEDKFVRQRWMAACDAHDLHFREFLACRERIMR